MPQHGLEEGPVLLKTGRPALLRRARPEDKPLFLEFLSRLSEDTLRMRFFSPTSPETAADLLLSQKPDEEKVTLVVLAGDPPRIVATGEYVRAKGKDTAEVAFLVDDAYQGKGLGTLLLERLALLAAKRGIRRFLAYTLAENQKMLSVFQESGFEVRAYREGGEVEVEFEIIPSEKAVERFEWREKVATIASLHPFFFPRGVAVVGASRDPQSVGYRVLENLVMGRFQGPVYPVNPEAERKDGVPFVGPLLAYESVNQIPGPVDLAVVTVPKEKVAGALEALGRRGVRAAVILTTGFNEKEAKGIADLARRYGMRILGPGSLGLAHTHRSVRLAAGLVPLPKEGGLALSSQSGTLARAVIAYAEGMGLGISSFASLGAKADVSSNDLLQFWEEDERTRVIVLYLETFGNPRRFSRLARRIGKKKPILAVHPSRDPLVRALFAQAGVIRVNDLEETFDVALLLQGPLPQNPRVRLIANASGPSNLALEALKEGGMEVEQVDLGSTAQAEDFQKALLEALASEAGSVFLLYVPMGFAEEEAILAPLYEAQTDKVLLASVMGEASVRARFLGKVPLYRFPESAAIALARTWAYRVWREEPLVFPDFPDLKVEGARRLLEGKAHLSPEEEAQLLEAFGLPLGARGGLELILKVEPHPLFGPTLGLHLPTPLGETSLGLRLSPLTQKDAKELLAPLEGFEDPGPYQEILLRVSRLLEEFPQVERLTLRLKGPGIAAHEVRLADRKP